MQQRHQSFYPPIIAGQMLAYDAVDISCVSLQQCDECSHDSLCRRLRGAKFTVSHAFVERGMSFHNIPFGAVHFTAGLAHADERSLCASNVNAKRANHLFPREEKVISTQDHMTTIRFYSGILLNVSWHNLNIWQLKRGYSISEGSQGIPRSIHSRTIRSFDNIIGHIVWVNSITGSPGGSKGLLDSTLR